MKKTFFFPVLFVAILFAVSPVYAVDTYPQGTVVGDATPAAPELAKRGEYKVGVRTLSFVDKGRLDVLKSTAENLKPLYDRELKVEMWYPAELKKETEEIVLYTDHLGRFDQKNLEAFQFPGRAVRDADIMKNDKAYPLVVISHGYPGSRYMLSYLAENLASKGYVVAAIGHTESTYEDVASMQSTFINRSLDQIFVLDSLEALSKNDSQWRNVFDAQNTALIGYSMGGYGTIRTIGASYSQALTESTKGLGSFLTEAENPKYQGDARVKAAVLFAPWGGANKLWTDKALSQITIPTLWIAGSEDDIAMYPTIHELFEKVVHSDRYFLTYREARHNPAPNAPPVLTDKVGFYLRWAEPVWDEKKINNINQHFVTAFLNSHLKQKTEQKAYLDVLVENSNKGVYALNEDKTPKETHTYWKGFSPRTAVGLTLEKRSVSK